MAHLIDKDALVAEIERRIKLLHQVNSPREQAVLYECKDILSFLDTLSVKEVQEEPVSQDLEEAAEVDFICRCENHIFGMDFHKLDMISAFKAGAKWQKENMMKDAIEREVKIDAGGYPYIDCDVEFYDYDKDIPLAKEGDKVKVIIVKDET